MKSNKAMGWSFIAIILVVITLLLVLLLFQQRVAELYQNLFNKNTCKSSVKSQDITTIKNLALGSDIKCPLQRIEIKEKSPEKIKEGLAKIYYNVCDEFGQGQLNLFGQRETTFCVIRDRVTFKYKDIKIDDFAKYLAETQIPGKGLTYSEFCSGFETERGKNIYQDTLPQFYNVPIDTSKDYSVIFVYAKGEEQLRELGSFLVGTSEGHATMYIGAGLVVGGGILIYTGAGSIIGVPLVIAGKIIAAGGTVALVGGGILNYFTNPDLKKEWASFFLIREFDEQELKKLPCEYLPAEQ